MPHFLQSPAWKKYQESLGVSALCIQSPGAFTLALIEKAHKTPRVYCPYGPEVTTAEALTTALEAVEKEARRSGVVYLRVEPTGPGASGDQAVAILEGLGYHRSHSIQPADTSVLDLTQDEAILLKGIGSTNRNLYHGIERRGLEITQSTDPADMHFLNEILEKISAGNDNFTPHNGEYLEKQAESLFESGGARLFLVRHEGQVIAASYVYEGDGVRYYAHSGADPEYRRLRAGQALVAHMIFEAKQRGFTAFDFYGIAPSDDPEHPWAGFTKFKQSFGGTDVHYAGTWEKPLKAAHYAIYQKARQLAGKRH